MPKFIYTAKKGPKEIIQGRLEARTKEEAIEKISQIGLLAIKVDLEARAGEAEDFSAKRYSGKVKLRDLVIFNRQLSSLVKSGMPLLDAISTISKQLSNPYFKYVIEDLGSQVREGQSLSAALERYPNVFSVLYISMVRASENSGNIAEALSRISEYQKNEEELKSRVKLALMYPLFITIVGIGTVLFMLIYVIPKLMHIFSNLGQDLPLPTMILINISSWLSSNWLWLLLIAITAFLILKGRNRKGKQSLPIDLFKLHLPLLGELIKKNELTRFCYAFQMLIKSGVPILKALKLSTPILSNTVIRRQLEYNYEKIEQGSSFGDVLRDSELIPAFMSNLIAVGEKSGRLDEALEEIVYVYDKDISDSVKLMVGFLEPFLILFMGLIVGFIVIAMLLPMFEMNLMIR